VREKAKFRNFLIGLKNSTSLNLILPPGRSCGRSVEQKVPVAEEFDRAKRNFSTVDCDIRKAADRTQLAFSLSIVTSGLASDRARAPAPVYAMNKQR
jgi:hypothetical protein